jgi:hypothetical protein
VAAAPFDYLSLQADAQELIEEFGDAGRLTRAARVADPAKPWLPVQGDTDAAPAQSIDVTGVFLSLDRTGRPDQVAQEKTQTVLVGGAEVLPEEIGPDWKLERISPADSWEVVSVEPLRPGPTLMLYRIRVQL